MLLHKLDAVIKPMLELQTEAAIKLSEDQFEPIDVQMHKDCIAFYIPEIYFEELD